MTNGSWMENFPWNRIAAAVLPDTPKPPADVERLRTLAPPRVKEVIGDGNYGGAYAKPDEQMLQLWQAGVEETRAVIAAM